MLLTSAFVNRVECDLEVIYFSHLFDKFWQVVFSFSCKEDFLVIFKLNFLSGISIITELLEKFVKV